MPTTPQRSVDEVRLALSRFPRNTPLDVVFAFACEQSARALNVARVGVWLFIENNTALRCVHLYELARDEHSCGTTLRVADYPLYFRSLNLQRAVPAEVAANDPRTAELADAYMKPLGIGSMLDAGLFLEGKLVGVVCHEHIGPARKFDNEARDFASSIADLLALRMQTAELQDVKAVFRTQEHRLLAGEKAESLAQMAAGVAHDFNNLLTIIAGHADMLKHLPLPAGADAHLAPILEASSRGQALVKELIAFARPERSGPPGVIDLTDVLTDFLPMVRSALGSKHHVVYEKATASAMVLMNKTQFCRIVFNLAINARDAMPEGGPVQIRVASIRATNRHEQVLHYVMVEVRDSGIGMDDETMRRIGEPYFTTKKTGTGLGLAIVRKNIDRAGGLLRVESQPGEGSVFRVLLPRVGASTGDTEEFPIPDGF